MKIGEAVAATGVGPFNGSEPVIVRIDKAGRFLHYPVSKVADQEIEGTTYISSGMYDPRDITEYSGRTTENVRQVMWIGFDFDLSDFTGLPKERLHQWPDAMLADTAKALILAVQDRLTALQIPYHRIDYTGYGVAAYIYLPPHDAEDVPLLQQIHAGLVERINAGVTLADTQVKDCGPRIQRLPGSVNGKGRQPRTVQTVEFVAPKDRPVTIDQLRSIAGIDGPMPLPIPQIVPKVGELLDDGYVKQIVRAVGPYWTEGNRHALALGLAGMMAKAGVPEEQAERVISLLSAGDSEGRDRINAVRTSYARVRAGMDVRGWFSLNERLDAATVQIVDEALETVRQRSMPQLVIGEKPGVASMPVHGGMKSVEFDPLPDSCLVGWIGEWVRLHRRSTEAPAGFHYGAAMTVAAAMIGRHVSLVWAGGNVFPNLFSMFVGPSGKSRKDTAIKMAIRCLIEPMQLPQVLNPEPRVVTDISSSEGITRTLEETESRNVLYYITELSLLMGNARRKGTNTILSRLIDLYDMPYVLENLNKQSPIRVEKPTVNIVAAVQPQILGELMTSSEISSGFANRWLYCCGTATEPIPVPDPVDWYAVSHHFKVLHDAVESYKEMGEMYVMRLDPEAHALWEAWYLRDWSAEGDEAQESMRVRHQNLMMKLALIYAVTDYASEIGVRHLQPAMDAVEWMWRNVSRLIDLWGQSVDSRIEDVMVAVLTNRGNMKKRDLYKLAKRREWATVDLDRVFKALLSAGIIQIDNNKIVGLVGDDDA